MILVLLNDCLARFPSQLRVRIMNLDKSFFFQFDALSTEIFGVFVRVEMIHTLAKPSREVSTLSSYATDVYFTISKKKSLNQK